MRIPFHKMHGAGNDFVVMDERPHSLGLSPAAIAALANRRTGIGCDQFIVIGSTPGADAFMRIFNPDGTEAGACGNATRCVADLLFRETGHRHQTIRTISGDLPSEVMADGRVQVDMGPVRLGWQDIPLARPMDTLHLDLPGDPAAASMGNPHVNLFQPSARRRRRVRPPHRARPAVSRPRQCRPGPGAGSHPPAPARLGTRGGADARLRLRRLRGAGERASPRPSPHATPR